MSTPDWEDINRKNWDERAPLVRPPHSPQATCHLHLPFTQHASSPDYKIQQFQSDPTYLSDVVKFDIPLLGDITGLRCVHLQCHIGTDTLSLARRGASSVVGLDFSPASLAEARALASATASSGGDKLTFVEASVYDALSAVPDAGSYDLVFTGIGALCWIPDISRWAAVVAGLLKPGGRLFIREGHPSLWSLDDNEPEGRLVVTGPYFERGGEAKIYEEAGTYVAHGEHVFEHTRSAEFNHGMGEILEALLGEGMEVVGLREHRSVPWDALPGQMEEIGEGEYLTADTGEIW